MKSVIYLALGDSISIDDYPDLEKGSAGNGAASLLAKKLEGQISEFHNYTADGATIANIQELQLKAAAKHIDRNANIIVTLTAGGNDVSFKSMRLRAQKNEKLFGSMMDEIVRDYTRLVIDIKKTFPNSLIVANTLYDPTDGTGKLPENCGLWADIADLYSQGRRILGNYVRDWCEGVSFTVVADIFKLFDGRGMRMGNKMGMYYDPFLIEPGVVGAEMIANLWYNILAPRIYTLNLREQFNDRSHEEAAGSARVRQV